MAITWMLPGRIATSVAAIVSYALPASGRTLPATNDIPPGIEAPIVRADSAPARANAAIREVVVRFIVWLVVMGRFIVVSVSRIQAAGPESSRPCAARRRLDAPWGGSGFMRRRSEL
jgi:hypothetical protein